MKKRWANGQFRRQPYLGGVKLLLVTTALGAAIQWLYTPPVEPITPLVKAVEVAPAVETPKPTPQPTTKALSVDEIVDGIHMLESTRGKAKIGLQKYCEDKGMSNQYGYGGMKLKICFKTHAEAQARIIKWVNKHYEKFDKNLGRTLCFYNLGVDKPNCDYYQNYLKIK